MTNDVNKKESRIVFTIVIILAVILLVIAIVKLVGKKDDEEINNNAVEQNSEKYVTKLDNNGEVIKYNNSNALNSTKKYKDIEISNIKFTSRNDISVLLANVKNTSSSKHKQETVKFTILGDDNSVIATIESNIPDLEPNEIKQLNVIATADIVNAKDFTIESK